MAKIGMPPLDSVAAMYLVYTMERHWFSSIRPSISFINWMVLIVSVIASYAFVYTDPASKVHFAVSSGANTFVFLCSICLGPYAYYSERAHLERYLLATRSDGGEVVMSLLRSGENISLAETLAVNTATTTNPGFSLFTSGVTGLSFSYHNEKSASEDGQGSENADVSYDQVLKNDFGHVMQSVGPEDIQRVRDTVAQQELRNAKVGL